MNEGNTPLIIFIFIAIASSITWNILEKEYSTVLIKSTLTTVVLFQIAVYINLGHLDPYFIVAMITTGILALVISVVISFILKKLKG